MARFRNESTQQDSLKQETTTARQLRVNAARFAPGANAQGIVNAMILEAQKSKIRHANGVTLPTSAARLLADARRNDLKHSVILAFNMGEANNDRPKGVAAHHIVSRKPALAHPSQMLLFAWGIGINDVDNGVYLPRFAKAVVPSLPNASKHSKIHTGVYHLAVFDRLVEVRKQPSGVGREVLLGIKAELEADTFPYRPEDVE